MRKLLSLLFFVYFNFLTISILAIADVEFEIIYTDAPGEGFHIRPKARQSLEEAVALVFSWLDHDAVVKIKVESFIDAERDALAEGKANHQQEVLVPGIYYTHLARKILFNDKGSDWDYDATIRVNFYDEGDYAYGDDLESNKTDFKSVIIHELTHNLGVTSWIEDEDEDEDENEDIDESSCLEAVYLYHQKFEAQARSNVCWELVEKIINLGISIDLVLLNYNNEGDGFTYFDTLLVDDQGNKVIDIENFKFLREDLFKLEDGDSRKTLYFPVEDNNGVVKLFPLNGMDGGHLKQPVDSFTLMAPLTFSGVSFRQWPSLERTIIQALGYRLKPVKKDASVLRWIGDLNEDGVIWRVTVGVDGVMSKEVIEAL